MQSSNLPAELEYLQNGTFRNAQNTSTQLLYSCLDDSKCAQVIGVHNVSIILICNANACHE